MKNIIILSYLFLFQVSCMSQNKPIVGTWSRGFQSKIETLTKIPDSLISKPFRSIESITFNKDATFLHKRSPPCGNDIFFNKKGTYIISNNELILKYNGGEFYKDFYKPCKIKCLTKKETITYIYNWLDDNSITIEDKKAALKEEERKNEAILKGLKVAERNGFIKGIVANESIAFPSYEITPAWLQQIIDQVNKYPESKKFNVATLRGKEYLSNYIFNESLPLITKSTSYSANHITLIDGKKLKEQIKFRIQNKNHKAFESSDKTKFKNIKLKNGFLSGRIKGVLVENFNEKNLAPIDIKFKIKLAAFKF